MHNILIALLLGILLFQCKENKIKTEVSLSAIEKEFPRDTQFKSIQVMRHQQKVVVQDQEKAYHFKEYLFKDEDWKPIAMYQSEVLGNVSATDFVFSLNDSLEQQLNFTLDSLQKSYEIESFSIEKPQVFQNQNPVEIRIEYKNKNHIDSLTFLVQ